ncbi:Flp family type IVb pilin [Desulfitobacterium sp. AusDCA]|uniref:Flp family type IVb pilin n=1 Tax=Desulfitobacterium sp. AusDCA TaxID=3240383 RepID=UPI003DA73299
MSKLMQIFKNEEGQAMTEYGLIIAVVALIAVVGLGVFGGKLNDFFNGLKLQ